MNHFTEREQIIEIINKLFIYTDYREWSKLQEEVLTGYIYFDMSSLGNEASERTAKSICESWDEGFKGLDAVNHLAGNFLITINDDQADVFAYATATHFKNSATKGKTREFVGSYDLHLVNTSVGWRIDKFRYNLKYMNGNLELV